MSARTGRLRRGLDVAGSVLFALVVIVPSVTSLGGLPSLGAAINTGTGVWRLSPDAEAATDERISLPGLAEPVTVRFEDNGVSHVDAQDDGDLFRTIGYVHARFRLGQMDLYRRQAQGRLAEVIGPAAVASDTFQIDIGVRRAAERDWANLAEDDEARTVLIDYAAGVNTAIRELTEDDRLPAMFKLLDYEPAEWSPVDSLAIQRVTGQRISFDDQSLVFSYAEKALPREVFDAWFPEIPLNTQHPYDKGPFEKLPLSPLPVSAYPEIQEAVAHSTPLRGTASAPLGSAKPDQRPLRDRLAALPANPLHMLGNSNAWVISGDRTESGGALLAADPHLLFSVPSVWYQMEGRSSSYQFSGGTVPGIPVPLLGKTDDISWGLTASQHPTAVYYQERTDPSKPDQYHWRGQWHPMTKHVTEVRVKGGETVAHETLVTAHGPVVQVQGMTVSAWWAGTLPSDNLNSMLKVLRAKDFGSFKESLRGWATPALNFFYADRKGDIGVVNAGVAPQVPGHNPALPLPGDGTADIVGSIPFDALPGAHNPPEGFISSANQREVSAGYPYQYSTSYNYPLPGWRSAEIVHRLSQPGKTSMDESAALQSDWHDNYARSLMPHLVPALKSARPSMSPVERKVADKLIAWDYRADPELPQSLFFEPLKNQFTWLVFEPWWTHYGIPQNPEESVLPVKPQAGSFANEVLRGTLVGWLDNDPDNQFFGLPDGSERDVNELMVTAFRQSVALVVKKFGTDVDKMRYDQHEKLLLPSLSGNPALDIGPFPWGGTPRTINASVGSSFDADGQPISNISTGGPTYRTIVDWGTGEARVSYPGGQSENPISPWYDNGVAVWMAGDHWPVIEGRAAERSAHITWEVSS